MEMELDMGRRMPCIVKSDEMPRGMSKKKFV